MTITNQEKQDLLEALSECQNTLEDSEVRCGDEGRLCIECQAESAMYWSRYFGLEGLTDHARRTQLEQFRPSGMPAEE